MSNRRRFASEASQTSFSDSGSDTTVVENTTPDSPGVISVVDSEDFDPQRNSTMNEDNANPVLERVENNVADLAGAAAVNGVQPGVQVNVPPPLAPANMAGMGPWS